MRGCVGVLELPIYFCMRLDKGCAWREGRGGLRCTIELGSSVSWALGADLQMS